MRVYLFDIDGTLIQTGGAGRAALDAAFHDVFGVADGTSGITLCGRTDSGIRGDLFARHQIEATPRQMADFHEAYLAHLPSFLKQYRGGVLPGILSLVATLADCSESVMGLLTGNVREGARLKLEHFGLYRHFPFGGFGDLHPDRDDVARAALQALRDYDKSVEPAELWVIGDTPSDVRCARAIGAKAAAVATGRYTVEELDASQPDLLFTDFSDPSPLLP